MITRQVRRTPWIANLMVAVLLGATLVPLPLDGDKAAAATITSTPRDNSGATALASAMLSDSSVLSSASFVAVPPSGFPHATSSPFSFFPTAGSDFAILSTGTAAIADDANVGPDSGASLGGGNVRGNSDLDVTVLRLDLAVPSGVNCLKFDFAFYSEEFPEYVGSQFNDAFLAELDASTWTTSSGNVDAPDNFAWDQHGFAIPAFIHNGRLDLLYLNDLAAALYTEHLSDPAKPPNAARFVFLDPRARRFYIEWETIAHDLVAALRGEAGRNPHDRDLADLVGQLSVRSDEFRVLWAGHDVRFHRSGTKRFHHPLVGDPTLAYESLQLPADPGLTFVTYSAEPGSPTEDALRQLAAWAVTRTRLAAVQENEAIGRANVS
jgi:hypothetical protein